MENKSEIQKSKDKNDDRGKTGKDKGIQSFFSHEQKLQRKQEELDELSQNADPLQFLQICHELTRMRRYKESVTFDPATAGSCLVVSELGKRLKFSKTATTTHSADSARFDSPIVLGTKGFTSGRHYWEVRVGLRNDWFVGVAKGTVPRTGMVAVTSRNGFFAIGKKGFDYQVNCPLCTILHLCPRPRNVGIYVDYAEGRISFYDVDEKLHIYSFKLESFAEKMFPCFYLYSRATKSQALVITSV
ncbi:E3 ubiquitin-protein ligase TRIM39-like [Solea senegalensis]|uniref:E3 ubiquitin-protein ligase TRIM39-like n=1 Tax=Solea senegalensis TaxID=28829 RepID=A0AAV6QXB0_SOLSE|nr:E3 ubiquitin-protein ligase TRIM39-like [Solea senegalensis]